MIKRARLAKVRFATNYGTNKPKMAYSRDALLERDKRETREIWSYGGWPIIV